jgi:CRP-like cAMP-binding protein
MIKLVNPAFTNINFKQSRSINYNLRLLDRNRVTSHLINRKKIEKGDLLLEENMPVDGIYFILKGKVKIFCTEFDKKPRLIRLAAKGDIVGFSSLNDSHYRSSAIALENIEAFYINKKSLKYILKNSAKLSLLFVNALVHKLQQFEMRQRYLNLFPAPERVIEVILLMGAKFGKKTLAGTEITSCTSRYEIGSFANTSSENVIRTLSKLKSEKDIIVEGRKIVLINRMNLLNRLKHFCCSNLSPNVMDTCYFDSYCK